LRGLAALSEAKLEERPFLGGGYEKESLKPAARRCYRQGVLAFFDSEWRSKKKIDDRWVNLFGYTSVYKVTLPFSFGMVTPEAAQKKFLQDSMHLAALPESLVMASLLRN
jgi:hypothetical protein